MYRRVSQEMYRSITYYLLSPSSGKLQVAESPSGEEAATWRRIKEAKPRILVTAPSNVAVDNIISRIFTDGFKDDTGNRYNPTIVRTGRGVGEQVKAVSLDVLVEDFIRVPLDEVKSRILNLDAQYQEMLPLMVLMRVKLQALKTVKEPLPFNWEARVHDEEGVMKVYYVDHNTKTIRWEFPTVDPGADTPEKPRVRLTDMPEFVSFSKEYCRLSEELDRVATEVNRLRFRVQNLQNLGLENIRTDLETQILDSAHIVFTTLNSSGTPSLVQSLKFHVVVVDEAAQAIEPSTLIALQNAQDCCVLVGDPQQLPATVFSQTNTQFERSLFERLEHCGHPVHLLDTQYRMHPKISSFPRQQFYKNMLKDGPNVLSDPFYIREYFDHYPALQPFVFLNLKSDVDLKGVSYRNPAEARLALNVYLTLKRVSKEPIEGKVGIITPYSLQLHELKNLFASKFGPSYTEEVELNTVDGYQVRMQAERDNSD